MPSALALGLALLMTTAHPGKKPPKPPPAPAATDPAPDAGGANPLLPEWTGAYGEGLPFARVKVEHFEPALESAMEAQLAAVDRIAGDPSPPTFENTLAALERSGRALDRVMAIYGVYSTTLDTPEFQAVEREMQPRLAAFLDKIFQNEKLYARVAAIAGEREHLGLDREAQRLAWYYDKEFVRAGARLDAGAKKRVAEINERLATLSTTFSQNVLADEEAFTVVEREEDLAGLPAPQRAAYRAFAEAHGAPGKWAVANTRSAVEPLLTLASRRDLREKVWRLFISRGDHGDAHDNKAAIAEILRLRLERAKLLGFESHAHWQLTDQMARTPDRAMALMKAVWPAAVARVREEVADMQKVADAEQAGITIEPWDYRYYAEKVRKARYDVDDAEVRPYLQLEQLREGMFWVAGELFDLHFALAKGVPVYHPDVRVWEVTDGKGRHVGLWFFDPYAREGKRSGAWMNAYRRQERFDGEVTTIVSNNANFVKAPRGQPVLVSWIDAQTLFHEFGHALHGLSSNVSYPSLSGTNVPRDYVEFPSQLLERWLATPEVLDRFARHAKTGKPMPKALVAKLQRAARFNQGFETVEYLSDAILDMKLHLMAEPPADLDAFERDALAEIGMPREIVLRHRLPQFLHVFSGDGYSAGYYAYLWADTLSADAYEAFTEKKGPYDPAVAARLKKHVFSAGNTVDPADGYRAFRGRDAGIGALMRKRGFPAPKADAQ